MSSPESRISIVNNTGLGDRIYDSCFGEGALERYSLRYPDIDRARIAEVLGRWKTEFAKASVTEFFPALIDGALSNLRSR